ncbi:3,4-dihydroxy-2-butanone 4-phosphate synthase [Psychromonas ingrahamii 37]|uniref:3,4-dihydroxy-2-butanone 4-phosphate synthase n=1 Tax=Psychromonas ingrahamii (strain DSM 17664 / CCUG 51855 / 37) TaxID=357804 RepID=A1SUU4_PSYIN|nr:bifunctional 3,4-dihydroxy-2-butanone-4-phosphate synthase/GTP cyclohydrolase II [Psychromonas ingrahamii]ABM03259.1 3,4-dihydroxy-2-butanone 4-phosphate synthase [Psychromonas ingrahamii 37]
MKLSTTAEIIEDIRLGKMVILMDDEDRENEGDLIMAADLVTPEAINFMATYGRGLVCLTLTAERCEQLKLPLMVDDNTAAFSTNFTVSIEAALGVTTGISAADRAITVQAAVAKDAKPTDIVMPGHIFPLMAQAGGVLTRAGHTEAGCDLARLAGREPAGVIVEILNKDGTMARRPDLEIFAEEKGIKLGTVADLIEYRNNNETTIERVSACKLPTEYGDFDLIAYQDTIDKQVHFALVNGEIKTGQTTNVRVHLQNTFADNFFSDRLSKRTWPLNDALQRLNKDGGVLVMLAHQETPSSLIEQVKQIANEDAGERVAKKEQKVSRRVGVGSQILRDLGVQKMALLSSEKKYHALSGFGLEVVDYITE